MKKSTVLATCLVNSNIFIKIEDAEQTIKSVFNDEFPTNDFNKWNSDMDKIKAKNIIKDCGVAKDIRVINFIREHWD